MDTTTIEQRIITFTKWVPPDGGRPLHDTRSRYAERCWLPLLGPSTLLLLRFATETLLHCPHGAPVPFDDVASALGLGGRNGDGGPLRRTIARAEAFAMARSGANGTLSVRVTVPELSPRQLLRSPAAVRDAHAAFRIGAAPADPAARHAIRLGRALADLGESEAEIERQLLHWHFSASIARAAAHHASLPLPGTGSPPSRGASGQNGPHTGDPRSRTTAVSLRA